MNSPSASTPELAVLDTQEPKRTRLIHCPTKDIFRRCGRIHSCKFSYFRACSNLSDPSAARSFVTVRQPAGCLANSSRSPCARRLHTYTVELSTVGRRSEFAVGLEVHHGPAGEIRLYPPERRGRPPLRPGCRRPTRAEFGVSRRISPFLALAAALRRIGCSSVARTVATAAIISSSAAPTSLPLTAADA